MRQANGADGRPPRRFRHGPHGLCIGTVLQQCQSQQPRKVLRFFSSTPNKACLSGPPRTLCRTIAPPDTRALKLSPSQRRRQVAACDDRIHLLRYRTELLLCYCTGLTYSLFIVQSRRPHPQSVHSPQPHPAYCSPLLTPQRYKQQSKQQAPQSVLKTRNPKFTLT